MAQDQHSALFLENVCLVAVVIAPHCAIEIRARDIATLSVLERSKINNRLSAASGGYHYYDYGNTVVFSRRRKTTSTYKALSDKVLPAK